MKIVYNPVHKQKLQLLTNKASEIEDFDIEVSNNTNVASNTTAVSALPTTYLKLDVSNSPNITISRDANGVIDEWTVDGTTYTPTYTGDLMTSYTDGTNTWTITRDGNNRITGVTKS